MMSERDDSSHFKSLHGVDQNSNYLQEERNYSVTEELSYARPSNYKMSPNDDRKGNWGSRCFILGCQNTERDLESAMLEKDKMPDTKHYTMAWIQEQNK